MTIREAHKTDVGPKIVFLFDGSWTRRKPHEYGVDADGEDDGACSKQQGGRAGARFSRPPEQPLAPEVASASSGHLGHQADETRKRHIHDMKRKPSDEQGASRVL